MRLGDADGFVLARAGLFFFFAGEAAAALLLVRRDGEDSADAAPRTADLRGDRRGEVVTPIVPTSSPSGIVLLLLLLSVPISVRGPANAARLMLVLPFVVDE